MCVPLAGTLVQGGLLEQLGDPLGTRKAREDRIAYQTLQTFSDRQLQDIGLSRGEVYRKVFDVTKIRESGL